MKTVYCAGGCGTTLLVHEAAPDRDHWCLSCPIPDLPVEPTPRPLPGWQQVAAAVAQRHPESYKRMDMLFAGQPDEDTMIDFMMAAFQVGVEWKR